MITIGKGYIPELEKRLKAAGISHNELARELKKSPTQVSRWFTANDERRVQPNLKNVGEIEAAVARLQKRKEKQGCGTLSSPSDRRGVP